VAQEFVRRGEQGGPAGGVERRPAGLKEIATRFDFRGSKSKIEWNEKELQLTLTSDDEHKLKSVVDILETRLVKRGIA
jgi:uncharacterized protein YajQ (UPF0234 family)